MMQIEPKRSVFMHSLELLVVCLPVSAMRGCGTISNSQELFAKSPKTIVSNTAKQVGTVPNRRNGSQKRNQAGNGANRHSADYMYGFAFAIACSSRCVQRVSHLLMRVELRLQSYLSWSWKCDGKCDGGETHTVLACFSANMV